MERSEPSAARQAYRPQIDTLRAVAVTSVLITHLLLPFGPAHQGVRLFFVISGFLITGILLKQRDQASQSFYQKLKTFYVRRAIRIWPIYYITLLAAAVVNLSDIRASLPWHLAYLSNFYYIKAGRWDPSVAGHLWSLSVEEQFYIVWPLLMLLIPLRRLGWVLAGGIAIAVGYRLISFSSVAYPDIATPAALDALCLGGTLAFAKHVGISRRALHIYLWSAAAASVLALLFLVDALPQPTRFAVEDLLFAITFVGIVAAADAGVRSPLKTVLEWPPVLYIGRISYGIYLYHLFAAYCVVAAAARFDFDLPRRGILTFVIVTIVTVAAASASWFALERPLASWKRRFSYAGHPSEVAAARSRSTEAAEEAVFGKNPDQGRASRQQDIQ